VESVFELEQMVVGLQKIGCEPENFEAEQMVVDQQKIDLSPTASSAQ